MSPDTESQIVNELVQIKKEVASIKKGLSLSVASGIIGASLIVGIILTLLRVFLSTRSGF